MFEKRLPHGWREAEIGTLGACFRGRGGNRADEQAGGLPCIRYGDIYTHHDCIVRSFCSAIAPAKAFAYTALQPGDLVFAGSGETPEEIGKATAYCGSGRAYAGADTIIFRPKSELDPSFAGYAVNSLGANRYKSKMGQGSSVFHISSEHLSRLRLRFPAAGSEQQRVAEILSTIDDAIEHTDALIAKTQQIKAGLMHDLFTRGVTPDGQLRPPREEAPKLYKESPLGWIPKEWGSHHLQKVADVRTGIAKNEGRVFSRPIAVQYLRVANVQDGFVDLSEMKTIQIEAADLERYRVLAGDVLMNEGGDLDKLGRGAVWGGSREPCVHQNHVFVVRCGPDILPPFLNGWTATSTARRYFMVAGKQTTNLASINKTQLGRLPVPVPPRQEQSLIVRGIAALDASLGADSNASAKLRLFKAGLMHDLLAGRVRVPVADAQKVAANV